MMKKMSLAALLMCMALALTACAGTDIGQYYQSAQLYLGSGDFASAAELFAQLGEYEDAADYALYCRGLQAIGEEKYDLARANLTAVNPFKSSGRYLMYLDALAAEDAGEMNSALELYEKLGSFADADQNAARLRDAIPEAAVKEGRALMAAGDYAAAREIFLGLEGYGASETLAENCTTALEKAAYNAAAELEKSGDLLGAMEAFTALGDSLDAAKRADRILSDIRAELDARFAAVTLDAAPALIDDYAELGDDELAKVRIAELNARFGKNLEIIAVKEPVIALGRYPYAESGEEREILWRVIKTENETLTLLAESVLDASTEAKPVPLMLTEAEAAATGEVMLPAMADLAVCGTEAPATPYAVAQGADMQDGAASYWLRDSLENDIHPVIGAGGAMALPGAETVHGIRPMIKINLALYTFTYGSGTREDPFRAE